MSKAAQHLPGNSHSRGCPWTCAHTCAYVHTHTHTYKEVQTCLVMEAEPSLAGQSHVLSTPVLSLCLCGGDTLNTLIMAYQSWSPGWVGETGSGVRGTVGASCYSCLGEDQSFLESPPVTGSAQTGFRLDRETSEAIEGRVQNRLSVGASRQRSSQCVEPCGVPW